MDSGQKRRVTEDAPQTSSKRHKKQWRVPRHNNNAASQSKSIQPGDSGIWATCDRGRESKCIGELRDLFAEYADALYGDMVAESTPNGAVGEGGIESDIQAEISELHQPENAQLFTPLRIDVQCVVFIKTEAPVHPVGLVKRICEDAMKNQAQKRTRFVKRLSPMTLMGRASEEGLENVARTVLAPHFHEQPSLSRKFAIRPTLRNHNILSRDSIINQVAKIIGPGHKVDLKDYDLLVVVEVYKNVCGVSVLDRSFDAMKRYNLAEIFDPAPKNQNSHNSEQLPPQRRAIESRGASDATSGNVH